MTQEKTRQRTDSQILADIDVHRETMNSHMGHALDLVKSGHVSVTEFAAFVAFALAEASENTMDSCGLTMDETVAMARVVCHMVLSREQQQQGQSKVLTPDEAQEVRRRRATHKRRQQRKIH